MPQTELGRILVNVAKQKSKQKREVATRLCVVAQRYRLASQHVDAVGRVARNGGVGFRLSVWWVYTSCGVVLVVDDGKRKVVVMVDLVLGLGGDVVGGFAGLGGLGDHVGTLDLAAELNMVLVICFALQVVELSNLQSRRSCQ